MGEALGTEGAIGARFQAGIEQLQAASGLSANQLAAIGYCFGGAVVLGMARAGMNLRGVASFHGALGTESPAEAGAVKARIKVYHGNEDSMVDDSQVEAFKAEMDAAGADYEFVGYDGAGHGFTNPGADEKFEKFGLGVSYNQAVAEDSWNRLAGFLDELFAD